MHIHLDIGYMPMLATFIIILFSLYFMLKFMLKDRHRHLEILEKGQAEFKEEMKFVHNRLDKLYRVLLDRTYGKNTPEEIK
jgi:hypothetical protein